MMAKKALENFKHSKEKLREESLEKFCYKQRKIRLLKIKLCPGSSACQKSRGLEESVSSTP